MTEGQTWARVSEEDQARMARQVDSLRPAESDDEGPPDWRGQVTEETNRIRTRLGIPELKTEPELHRYARALGFIGH